MTRGVAWLMGITLVFTAVVWQLVRHRPASEPLPVLYTLGGDFTLDSTLGRPLSLSELKGDLVLLNFGYTGCPDVCPAALARMRDALAMVDEARGGVVPVFVTLDPERDTVDRMAPYVRFFHPDLIGMTGSEAEIAAAAEPFKVFYRRESAGSGEDYAISHSSHIYLLDRAGRVRATFGESVPVPAIARAVTALQAESTQLAREGDDGFR